jgi:hypothetical protein
MYQIEHFEPPSETPDNAAAAENKLFAHLRELLLKNGIFETLRLNQGVDGDKPE